MKKPFLGLSLLFSLGVLMTACGDSDSGGSSECPSGQVPCDGVCITEITPTLGGAEGIQLQVFTPTCTFTNCHGSMGIASAGLQLSSIEVSADNLLGVASTQVPSMQRVVDSQPSSSYLMNKLTGMEMAPNTVQMPVGGMLCDARLNAVRQWIDDGAPIN